MSSLISRSTNVREALRSRQRGFLLNPFRFGGGAGSDPHWANVKMLLKFNGTNGSTTFTDHSTIGKTLTRISSPVISTAQSKFGGASGDFQRLGYLQASDAAYSPGTGDFTIDGWIWHTTASGTSQYGPLQFFTLSAGPANTQNNCAIFTSTGSVWAIYRGGGFTASSTTISTGVWQHFELSRSGSTLQLFIDGTSVISVSNTYDFSYTGIAVGTYYSSAFNFDGYIDDLRLTVGVARNTSSFTPPTTEAPTS